MSRVTDVCPLMFFPEFSSHRSNKDSSEELYLDSSVVQSEQLFPAALLSAFVPKATIEKALFSVIDKSI